MNKNNTESYIIPTDTNQKRNQYTHQIHVPSTTFYSILQMANTENHSYVRTNYTDPWRRGSWAYTQLLYE